MPNEIYQVGILKDTGGIPARMSKRMVTLVDHNDLRNQQINISGESDPVLVFTVLKTLQRLDGGRWVGMLRQCLPPAWRTMAEGERGVYQKGGRI